jgi:uncharacterized protein involved in outer membrane biogenesis
LLERGRPLRDNGRMRILKWVAIVLLGLALLLGAAALALNQWLNSADFRARVEREASAALGVPLQLGALAIDLWPLPGVAADQVLLKTQPPLTIQRVEVRPQWAPLLAGRLELGTLVVRGAVLPQPAIAALAASLQKRDAARPAQKPAARSTGVPWPQRMVLDDISWVDAQGQRITVDARADLGGDGLLDAASFKVVRGRFAGARGELRREPTHWPLRVHIGGGEIGGKLQIQPGKGGLQLLQGQLQTENVEVSALTAPSNPLTGKLQAQTTLRAEYRELGGLADALTTQTRFTVRDALLAGLDLAQAVKTVGINRGGSTRLDTLAGQLHTQGRAAQLNNLVATSGGLAANGNIAMAANRSLSGRITVDVATAKGTVGVPLQVGGTVDAPSVMLTQGALLGAAIGTAIAPGAGTAAGARVGDQLGDKMKRLFGK